MRKTKDHGLTVHRRPMIFYPETGPHCPALPAGQACTTGIGAAALRPEAGFAGCGSFLLTLVQKRASADNPTGPFPLGLLDDSADPPSSGVELWPRRLDGPGRRFRVREPLLGRAWGILRAGGDRLGRRRHARRLFGSRRRDIAEQGPPGGVRSIHLRARPAMDHAGASHGSTPAHAAAWRRPDAAMLLLAVPGPYVLATLARTLRAAGLERITAVAGRSAGRRALDAGLRENVDCGR